MVSFPFLRCFTVPIQALMSLRREMEEAFNDQRKAILKTLDLFQTT